MRANHESPQTPLAARAKQGPYFPGVEGKIRRAGQDQKGG